MEITHIYIYTVNEADFRKLLELARNNRNNAKVEKLSKQAATPT